MSSPDIGRQDDFTAIDADAGAAVDCWIKGQEIPDLSRTGRLTDVVLSVKGDGKGGF